MAQSSKDFGNAHHTTRNNASSSQQQLCKFHSCNDNDTLSPPMKNEQSDKYILDDFHFYVVI